MQPISVLVVLIEVQ